MIIGFIFVKPVPHAEHPGTNADTAYTALATEASEATDPFSSNRRESSRTRSLHSDEDDDSRDDHELSPSRRPVLSRADSMVLLRNIDVHGKKLFKMFDFWLLVSIMFLCELFDDVVFCFTYTSLLVSGTGLMCG